MPGWFGNPPPPIEPMPLSSELAQRLEHTFGPESRDEARRILEEECGRNIPGWEIVAIEEMRTLAIEFSGGSIDRLQQCIDVAKCDFRDFYCLVQSTDPEEMLKAYANYVHPVRTDRGFPAWTGPIVGPIVGMLLALPAFLDPDGRGSTLLGVGVGGVVGLIAGVAIWASSRKT